VNTNTTGKKVHICAFGRKAKEGNPNGILRKKMEYFWILCLTTRLPLGYTITSSFMEKT